MTFVPSPDALVAPHIYKTTLPGLLYLEHSVHLDSRGFFAELALIPDLEAATGSTLTIKQLNLAHSQSRVVRGLHAEGWNKLVTVLRGTVFSAIVDLRPDSATFGQLEVFLLGDGENSLRGCLYIPVGLGNSICVVNGPVDYLYAVDRLYRDRDQSGDQAISLFDPDLNIAWPIPRDQMIVSDRDLKSITLREKFPEKYS